MKIEVDSSNFIRYLNRVVLESEKAWADTGEYFKDITPKKTGFAKENTKYRQSSKEIVGGYAYAKELDEGRSKQAPKGMSDPSFEYFSRLVDKILR